MEFFELDDSFVGAVKSSALGKKATLAKPDYRIKVTLGKDGNSTGKTTGDGAYEGGSITNTHGQTMNVGAHNENFMRSLCGL